MKMSKELYEQPYWKEMQSALFETFDIYCFDGNTLEVICSGPNVPEGWFYCVANDLAKVDGKTDILVSFCQDNKEDYSVIIRI